MVMKDHRRYVLRAGTLILLSLAPMALTACGADAAVPETTPVEVTSEETTTTATEVTQETLSTTVDEVQLDLPEPSMSVAEFCDPEDLPNDLVGAAGGSSGGVDIGSDDGGDSGGEGEIIMVFVKQA